MLEHRILIVDDDEHIRFVLTHALGRVEDFTVSMAGNSLKALAMAKEEHFDLLITDFRLPRMNGLALTSAFRKLNPDTPVVWLTAHGCYRIKRQADMLGVYQCLNKPVEIHEIRAVAFEALESVQEHEAVQ
jgi:DNA-binding NtrC family response regulator